MLECSKDETRLLNARNEITTAQYVKVVGVAFVIGLISLRFAPNAHFLQVLGVLIFFFCYGQMRKLDTARGNIKKLQQRIQELEGKNG